MGRSRSSASGANLSGEREPVKRDLPVFFLRMRQSTLPGTLAEYARKHGAFVLIEGFLHLRRWLARIRRYGKLHDPVARLATPSRESLIFKPDKLSGHGTVSHAP